jgi:ribosomal protein L13E
MWLNRRGQVENRAQCQLMQLLFLYTNDLPCYQKIKVWFNNHGRETSGKSKNAKLLDLSSRPKKTKKLQSWQAYSRLYFDDRVKSTFHEHLKVHRMEFEAGTISEVPKQLAVLRKVTTEILEGESDEVKAEVERYQQEHYWQQEHDDDMPDDSANALDSSEEASEAAKEAKRVAQAKVYLE